MDMQFKDRFCELWRKYFPEAEVPLAFWYSDSAEGTEKLPLSKERRCFIGDLDTVRKGQALRFDQYSIGCHGGKKYCGFSDAPVPDFEYFLSCGIPGKVEGERYKKTPGLVKEYESRQQSFSAPDQYLVFRRFDQLGWADQPIAVVFFAPPDVIAGLFTLANFAEAELDGVHCPFSAGCGAIVKYPMLENTAERPRAVLGLFDVSARPYVKNAELSFAVPMGKFVSMVNDMEESFLITKSWAPLRRRIEIAFKRG